MFNKKMENILNDVENKFIVLGGRPEVEKTTMAFKIAESFAQGNNTVAVFSAGKTSDDVRGKISLDGVKLTFEGENDVSASDISNKVKEIKRDNDLKLVVVDYKEESNDNNERNLLFTNLRTTCDELNVKFLVTTPVSDRMIGKENLSIGDLFNKNDIAAKVADKIIFLENEEAFKVMK